MGLEGGTPCLLGKILIYKNLIYSLNFLFCCVSISYLEGLIRSLEGNIDNFPWTCPGVPPAELVTRLDGYLHFCLP